MHYNRMRLIIQKLLQLFLLLDIAERLITAGYGWDKILQYHSKVSFITNIRKLECVLLGRRRLHQEAHSPHLHVQG